MVIGVFFSSSEERVKTQDLELNVFAVVYIFGYRYFSIHCHLSYRLQLEITWGRGDFLYSISSVPCTVRCWSMATARTLHRRKITLIKAAEGTRFLFIFYFLLCEMNYMLGGRCAHTQESGRCKTLARQTGKAVSVPVALGMQRCFSLLLFL